MTSTVQPETPAERKERKRKLEEDLALLNAAEEEENEKTSQVAILNQIPEKYRSLFQDVWTDSLENFNETLDELRNVCGVIEHIRVLRMRKHAKFRKTEGNNAHSIQNFTNSLAALQFRTYPSEPACLQLKPTNVVNQTLDVVPVRQVLF